MSDNHQNDNAVAVIESGVLVDTSRFTAIKAHVSAMNDFVKECMIEDVDYGNIPGIKSKILLKQGAEKICQLLNVAPTFHVESVPIDNEHRECIVKTDLVSRTTGVVVGSGIGSCSTMEKKYRWRNIYENGVNVGREENQDIADQYNTVLKMAKKRSLVDAVITIGVCSGLFTQDLEDEQTGTQSLIAGKDRLWANIPYNDSNAREAAKKAGWRFDSQKKQWSGFKVTDAFAKYVVGGSVKSPQAKVEVFSAEDELPESFNNQGEKSNGQ